MPGLAKVFDSVVKNADPRKLEKIIMNNSHKVAAVHGDFYDFPARPLGTRALRCSELESPPTPLSLILLPPLATARVQTAPGYRHGFSSRSMCSLDPLSTLKNSSPMSIS